MKIFARLAAPPKLARVRRPVKRNPAVARPSAPFLTKFFPAPHPLLLIVIPLVIAIARPLSSRCPTFDL
jgi:hypothetical protein